MSTCHDCGAHANWRDDERGVYRCAACVTGPGVGRRHSLVPTMVTEAGHVPTQHEVMRHILDVIEEAEDVKEALAEGPEIAPDVTADAGGLPSRPGAGEPAGATQEPHTIDAVPGGDAEGGVESGFDPDFRKQSVWLNLEWWWDHAADDADREECFRAAMGFGRRSDSRLALAEKRFREFDPFAEEAGE